MKIDAKKKIIGPNLKIVPAVFYFIFSTCESTAYCFFIPCSFNIQPVGGAQTPGGKSWRLIFV